MLLNYSNTEKGCMHTEHKKRGWYIYIFSCGSVYYVWSIEILYSSVMSLYIQCTNVIVKFLCDDISLAFRTHFILKFQGLQNINTVTLHMLCTVGNIWYTLHTLYKLYIGWHEFYEIENMGF